MVLVVVAVVLIEVLVVDVLVEVEVLVDVFVVVVVEVVVVVVKTVVKQVDSAIVGIILCVFVVSVLARLPIPTKQTPSKIINAVEAIKPRMNDEVNFIAITLPFYMICTL